MSRLQFDMGTSAMAEPKFGFHGEPLRLRGSDGGSRCGKNVLDSLKPLCETETVNESLVKICTSCLGLNVAFRLVLLQVTMQLILCIF